jgi:Na+-driven multidrug efflux pump
MRGLGAAVLPMFITLSGICFLRVFWILVVFPHNRVLENVEVSYPITWITTSILFFFYHAYYVRKNKIK